MSKLHIEPSIAVAKKDRDELNKPFRVESVNTGRIWGFDSEEQVEKFFFGRNRPFYRALKTNSSQLCNCGKPTRYTHRKDGEIAYSCNKYGVCLSYNELLSKVKELTNDCIRLAADCNNTARSKEEIMYPELVEKYTNP
jgi:hypothetical protein